MNTLGTIKDVDETTDGKRQFVVNCLGSNDRTKYYLVSSFGDDYNPPIESKALTSDSQNKDDNFVLGILNKLKFDDLNGGDRAVFSTSEDGSEIKSFIKFRNDKTIEFNGVADFLAGFTKLQEGFDQAIEDLNKTNAELNKIITALGSWTPLAQDGGLALKTLILANLPTNLIDSIASIDDSKKDNLKIE